MKVKYIYLMMAGAFLLASCNNEDTPLQAGQDSDAPAMNLPEGTFVVDYTAMTDDAGSRAGTQKPIQSLDYLLYESIDNGQTYTLSKRRAIPDIDIENTQWPLSRENGMTWRQREALKDTLRTSNKYKAVFVANAADWIWDDKEDSQNTEEDKLSNTSSIVLQNANINVENQPNFTEARLLLPSRVFTDNDMYYMAVVDVDGETNPNSVNVVLKRVINKIEVKLDDEIATDEEGLGTYISDFLSNYYDFAISKDDSYTGALFASMQTAMQTFVGKFEDTPELDKYENNLKNFITSDASVKKLFENISGDFKTDFIQKLATKMELQLKWGDIAYVKLVYKANSWASAIGFDKTSVANAETMDPIKYVMDLSSRSFIFYVFGKNVADDDLNQIATIQFYKEGESDPAFSLSGETISKNIEAGGNRSILITCKPANEIGNSENYQYKKENYNLKSVLNWTKNDLDYTLDDGVERLEGYINDDISPESLNDMTLNFQVPCYLVPLWTVVDQTNN